MFGLLGDVVKIATAPVKIAVEVAKPVLRETENMARAVTKPVADTLSELADEASKLNK